MKVNSKKSYRQLAVILIVIVLLISLTGCFLDSVGYVRVTVKNHSSYSYYIYAEDEYMSYISPYGTIDFTVSLKGEKSKYITIEAYRSGYLIDSNEMFVRDGKSYTVNIY